MAVLDSLRTLPAVCSLLLTFSSAQQIQFYDQSTRFGFALTSTLLDNATQVYMQVSAPVSYGWAAVGTGTMMRDSTMFILYPSEDNESVTLSVRTTTQHYPPKESLADRIHARITESSIKDGTMMANIVWQEYSPILSGGVDPREHKQGFIWAVGPSHALASDKTDQTISRHSTRGVFFANMVASQVMADDLEPPSIRGTSNVEISTQPKSYRLLVLTHSILMGSAFVLIFPFGIIGLRLNLRNKGFTVHWILQRIAFIAVIGGFGIAITMSIVGIEYSHFREPHQIVGMAMFFLVTLQGFLGHAHHLRFKLYNKRTVFSYAHMALGRIVVYGGTVNAVLGFVLCGRGLPVVATIALGITLGVMSEFITIRAHLRSGKTAIVDERFNGYTTGYHKIQDMGIFEQELLSRDHVPSRDYTSHGYSEQH